MRVELIIPKSTPFDANGFDRLIKAKQAAFAQTVRRDFEATTRTWDRDVKFYIEYTADGIAVGTDDKIYALVEAGSPMHDIPTKTAPMLIFPANYKAKTSPGVIGSSRGGKYGKIRKAKIIYNHPGFQARRFVDAIRIKNDPKFFSDADEALSRANA